MKRPKRIYKNYFFRIGIAEKETIDDFLLLPVPACGFVKGSDGKSWGGHIAVKFGFRGVFIAFYRIEKK
jgi:hypothetical protein